MTTAISKNTYSISDTTIDLIDECGPQELDDIITECQIQSVPYPTREEVIAEVERMVAVGELYTNGEWYSPDASDVL